jgi:glycosyltransferase involved in cell wall biosynthesis
MHAVSLDGLGGVEVLFRGYLAGTRDVGLSHDVLLLGKRCHGELEPSVRSHARSISYVKYWHGLRSLGWPRRFRERHLDGIMRRRQPDLLVVYNRLGDRWAWEAGRRWGCRLVHYDRGTAWWARPSERIGPFLASSTAVLCNSHAARRMLELRWGLEPGRALVRHNAVRPDIPVGGGGRGVLRVGPVRLAVAARLVPHKGVPLALHALKILRAGGLDCELHVAGTGPDAGRLQVLAERLGLDGSVVFRGLVRDMASFYGDADIFLCPSLVEPFGNVCIEAMALGCPVVCTAVDGLPESVVDGVTGFCVPARRTVAEYAELGGSAEDLAPYVYDPAEDALAEPRAADPGDLAEAVSRLAADAGFHERMSEAAARRAREMFGFDVYVRNLDKLFADLAHGETVPAAEGGASG